MEELIGIYKGLRLPLLGLVLVFIGLYVFWPSRKKEMEHAKYSMLDDDFDGPLSKEALSERKI